MNQTISFYFIKAGKFVKLLLEILWYPMFCCLGRKPFTFGYNYYKNREIVKSIRRSPINDGPLPPGFGFRIDERIVEYSWLFQHLSAGPGTVLDAGSGLNHGFLLKREPVASKRLFISTLYPEHDCYWQRQISYIFEDLRDTCYRDSFFDDIVSISTLEHIGLDNTMLYTTDPTKKEKAQNDYLRAIIEWRRLLKTGGNLFVTFPFGRHVNHGWFQVFDGDMVDRLIATFGPSYYSVNYFQYTPEGWKTATRDDLAEATYFDIQVQRKYDADYAAASRGVACLALTK